jgi:hypothetical protein
MNDNPYMKVNIFFLFLICSTGILQAQIQGTVVEKKSKLPIPFASVGYTAGTKSSGVIADAQGKFSITQHPISQLNVSCLGYKTEEIRLDTIHSMQLIIELEEQTFLISELLVTPKNNPALRILRKVLENKDQNNFEKYENYSYRCYFKTIGDYQTSIASNVDSMPNKPDKPLIISETVTLCRKSDRAIEEKIIATRTSGMKTPIFGQASYVAFYKAISFYNSSIQIFGESESNNKMMTDYLSPLCNDCLSAYNYQLEEEYITGNDTLFEISYYPKKNKNFSGLMGTMFIHSNTYALSSIVASPFEKGLIDFKFKQEYQWVDGKWFPVNLEEEIGFLNMPVGAKKSGGYFAYLVSSKIDSISFDIPEKALPNRLERIFIDEKSIAHSQSIIDSVRSIPLSEREIKTYHFMDSIVAAEHIPIDAIINSITKVDEGKISVNKIDVNYARIYSYNSYEGSRYGLGLSTNENLIKFLSVGAYFGYGIQDKTAKYGGNVEFTLNHSHDLKLNYSYQNSLKEAGSNLPGSIEFINRYYQNVLAYRFDQTIEHKIEGSYHIWSPLKIKASLSARNMTPMYDYSYQGRSLSDYIADELQFSLQFAPGARYATLGNHRMLIAGGNPVFNVTYTRGADFLRDSRLSYNKWEVSMNFIAYNGRIGQSNLRIKGGYIDSPLPYGLLFTGEGSKGKLLSLFVHNSFQTMRPYEFLSDKYIHAFYFHNFGSLLFKTRIFKPEFLVAYNAGWGDLENASYHDIDFHTKNHIYQETGLVIDNLLRYKYLNVLYLRLGVGGFYRLGYYREKDPLDNLALKLSITISFK